MERAPATEYAWATFFPSSFSCGGSRALVSRCLAGPLSSPLRRTALPPTPSSDPEQRPRAAVGRGHRPDLSAITVGWNEIPLGLSGLCKPSRRGGTISVWYGGHSDGCDSVVRGVRMVSWPFFYSSQQSYGTRQLSCSLRMRWTYVPTWYSARTRSSLERALPVQERQLPARHPGKLLLATWKGGGAGIGSSRRGEPLQTHV